jgi:hypothetical protein
MEEHGEVLPADLYLDSHRHVQTPSEVLTSTSKSRKQPQPPSQSTAGHSKKLAPDRTGQAKTKQQMSSTTTSKSLSQQSGSSGQANMIGGSQSRQQLQQQNLSPVIVEKEEDSLCRQIRTILQRYVAEEVNNGTLTLILGKSLEVAVQSSAMSSLVFPVTLTSFHRMFVHQIAEELALVHRSIGEGNERRIEVARKGVAARVAATVTASSAKVLPPTPPALTTVSTDDNEEQDENRDSDNDDDDVALAQAIEASLHFNVAESNSVAKGDIKQSSVASKPSPELSGKGNNKGKKDKPKDTTHDLDEDAFLELAVQQNKVKNYIILFFTRDLFDVAFESKQLETC